MMNNVILLASDNKANVWDEIWGISGELSIQTILIRMTVALLVAVFIYFIYKFTFNGVTFNRNFGGTIFITTLVTAVIMMIIGSNLALSLGMVGALSIIRFRNAVKDSRDITFVFWSVAAGLAAGTGLYPVALLGTLFIGICVVIFGLTGFSDTGYLLVIRADSSLEHDRLSKTLNHYTKKFRMRMKNTAEDSVEIIYELQFRKGADNAFVEKVSQIQGVLSVNLVAKNEEI